MIFVSYARADEKFVLRLISDLREKSVPVWVDQLDIPIGKPWDTAIEDALDGASHFLLVVSTSSKRSQNVLNELDFAIEKQKNIIPVLIDDSSLPLRIRRMQYIDFNQEYSEALEKLLAVIPVERRSEESPPHISQVVNQMKTISDDAETVDISQVGGYWVSDEDEREGAIYLKQEEDRVVGFYDLGEGKKVGIMSCGRNSGHNQKVV